MAPITEVEWQALEDGLDTSAILCAVDALDRLRTALANSSEGGLSAMRDELLQLHRSAQAVRKSGTSVEIHELFDLTNDIELQIGEWLKTLNSIQATLSAITAIYPESLAYED
ncbi:transposase [Xanthomonas theicola]|uniref:Transposase n=1 Tax=Xanthomonas theicola TaxID=56464 RepID=A0A2S6ZGJ7_9XANT|nr:transposase [Xanthomonas theicola]PPT91279.1 hypothetical protein XthCFBP4691_08385 [Xanthomonas theicola]QNH24635.1 transposase [Xanthomonas theicola]